MNHLDQMQAMFDQLFTAGQHGQDLSGQKSPEKSVTESVKESVKIRLKNRLKSVDIHTDKYNLRLTNSQEREKS